MKTCPSCQSEISEDSLFCPECGHAIESMEKEEKTPPIESPETEQEGWVPPPNPQKAEKRKKIFTVLAIVLLVAIFLGGIFFWFTKLQNKRNNKVVQSTIYMRDDKMYCYINEGMDKAAPVTRKALLDRPESKETENTFVKQKAIIDNWNGSTIAYITQEHQLFLVPIKDLSYKNDNVEAVSILADENVEELVGFTPDNQILVYKDKDGALKATDGENHQLISTDKTLNDVVFLGKNTLAYGVGADEKKSTWYVLELSSLSEDSVLIGENIWVDVPKYNQEQLKQPGFYYLQETETIKGKNYHGTLMYYDLQTKTSETIDKDVTGIYEGNSVEKQVYYWKNSLDQKSKKESMGNLYYWGNSTGGAPMHIADDVVEISDIMFKKPALVYWVKKDDIITGYYYRLSSTPQEIGKNPSKLNQRIPAKISIDHDQLALCLPNSEKSKTGGLMIYPINRRGVLGDSQEISENIPLQTLTPADNGEFLFFKNVSEANKKVGDLYCTKQGGETLVERDVFFSSQPIAPTSHHSFFFIGNINARNTQGTLKLYRKGSVKSFGDEGFPLPEDGYYSTIYAGEDCIFIGQNVNQQGTLLDIYRYNGKQMEQIEYDVRYISNHPEKQQTVVYQ